MRQSATPAVPGAKPGMKTTSVGYCFPVQTGIDFGVCVRSSIRLESLKHTCWHLLIVSVAMHSSGGVTLITLFATVNNTQCLWQGTFVFMVVLLNNGEKKSSPSENMPRVILIWCFYFIWFTSINVSGWWYPSILSESWVHLALHGFCLHPFTIQSSMLQVNVWCKEGLSSLYSSLSPLVFISHNPSFPSHLTLCQAPRFSDKW